MKQLLLIVVTLLLCAVSSQAQQVFAEAGRVTSKFNYTNSDGQELTGLVNQTNFHYALGYRRNLSPRFHASGAFTFNQYGSLGNDPVYGNSYEWSARYFGINVGMDYEFYKKKEWSFFTRASFEPEFLMSGNQVVNNEIYDLNGVEQFDETFLFVNGGLGVNYCADGRVVVRLKYEYGYGSPLFTTDPETLRFSVHRLTLGVIVGSKYCSYCYQNSLKGS
ncbi:outer membrane beta-barrel protein [Sanyastnella coralliicola]|uniref:outer membrane beta-barrel protein n=1 Tax=Sanyastnella coralliicola TaxID=3069118 RepID=UPI0027BA7F2E|nr:hypothetical protein [Longitalea sp. SCSIO 12813]